MSPLGAAIIRLHEDRLELVRRLLGCGGDPNSIVTRSTPSDNGVGKTQSTSALLASIKTESLPMVQLLVDYGAQVNRAAKLGINRTPLQLAAEIGSYGIVRFLLTKGGDVNAEPTFLEGGTALQLAAKGGYVGVAELLVDSGANLNAAAGKLHGKTALEGAAEYGRIDMLKFLHKSGARMDQAQFDRAVKFAEDKAHMATKRFLGTLYPELVIRQPPAQPSLPPAMPSPTLSLDYDAFLDGEAYFGDEPI